MFQRALLLLIIAEIPDPSTEMAKQPDEQSIPFEEKGEGESPDVDQVFPGSIAYELSVAQALPFKAGRIQYYLNEWETISSDRNILDIVNGCQIAFKSYTPHQVKHPKEIKFSNAELGFIDTEIQRLLEKGVIVPSCHETKKFVSAIYVRQKPDGSHQLILNLKRSNEHVAYHHFKMESLKSALQMIKPGCYMP